MPPSVQGEPYTLEAVVGSGGPGQGEVTVVFTLRDRATWVSYREERTVHLGRGERLLVTASVPAPPATTNCTSRPSTLQTEAGLIPPCNSVPGGIDAFASQAQLP